MNKLSDIISIKIKIKDNNLTFEEKVGLILSNLRGLIRQIEDSGGNVQRIKGSDIESSISYVHLKQKGEDERE
ncbi:hypothetical protein GCM10010451_68400 [Streptomyces virens]|uniref:Uncharacterized protein n=1 Tax=Streptomyces virens TaxID=285572 RepID=A0ABP6HK92_9ACTN